jgi:hypothetical protein
MIDAATPTVENTAVTEQTVKEEFVWRNERWMAETAIQKKGKGAGTEHTVLIPLPTETYTQFLARYAKAVGQANFEKSIATEVIRQASRDAEKDAETAAAKAGKDGQYTLQEWMDEQAKWHLPGARRAGEGVKQIREKLIAVMKEMEPLMDKSLKKQPMTQDELNRLLQLMAEFSELSEKEEGKSRQGKTKKAAAAIAPAK